MRVKAGQIRSALDRPAPDIRLYLLHGPDEAGAAAMARRLGVALGTNAERVVIEPAALRAEPSRLADEAASMSLFGERRWIQVSGAGEESLAAAEALLDAAQAGNPVVMIAPALKTTAKLVKLADASPRAISCGFYVPDEKDADAIVAGLARDAGLRIDRDIARRVVAAAGGNRAIMAQEIDKLALYLDAAPDRPGTVESAVYEAICAGEGEVEIGTLVAAVIAQRPRDLGEALLGLAGQDASPIPWLRALVRRLAALMEMRARVDAGEGMSEVVERARVFFKEREATLAALRTWSSADLAAALMSARAAERDVIAAGAAATLVGEQALVTLARA